MSAESNPPSDLDRLDEAAINDGHSAEHLRFFSRSPHPYLYHGQSSNVQHQYRGSVESLHGLQSKDGGLSQPVNGATHNHDIDHMNHEHDVAEPRDRANEAWNVSSQATTVSESGTEADDERPVNFGLKALPPPMLRPRKGLKVGEKNEEAFLTPSMLDDEGRRISLYRRRSDDEKVVLSEEQKKEEQEKVQWRRLHELARRTSEVALVGVIVLAVLSGKGVWTSACRWRNELLAHICITAVLILVYPVKLSIVDTRAIYNKPWQRFRVPASFDPATVLYPPFLPVLVALSVSPINPNIILPNIILGLASLPQRLFPRSSRLGGFNVVHWLVSIIPLIAAEQFPWLRGSHQSIQDATAALGLSSETLVSLYPLHHALLTPLHYLTTTSLLISELYLLSVALINLLLHAQAPQAVILKACLWIGGVALFVACDRVLHWNVTLARVPRWRFRRPGHPSEERKSLVDAVTELIRLQRASYAFKTTKAPDSDADEDEPPVSIKQRSNGQPTLDIYNLIPDVHGSSAGTEPKSAVELRQTAGDHIDFGMAQPKARPRSSTMPTKDRPEVATRQSSKRRRDYPSHLMWCLQLTSAQAGRRKWIFAGYIYVVILAIVFGPVRNYVASKGLQGQDPFGWAIGYLFGHIEPLRNVITSLDLADWIVLPQPAGDLKAIQLTLPLNVPAIRTILGASIVRLLLIAYWGLVLLVGLLAVFNLTAYVEVDTRRKVFHGVMVAMLLPSTFVDPCYCALALSLVLAVFLILEVIRAGQVPPIGNAIGRFVAPYIDGRDLRGPVVVSHIFLLIGCAVPLWFSLAGTGRSGTLPWNGWDLEGEKRDVGMIAGVVCVGMGDAAASLIGRRYGRHKWPWVGGKSLEGSAAFAVAVTVGLMFGKVWLEVGGWRDSAVVGGVTEDKGASGSLMQVAVVWLVAALKAMFCACAASFMEAVLTGANDNVVVPIALWLLVMGVRL